MNSKKKKYCGIWYIKTDIIKKFQNTPQLCWGDEWSPLSPGERGLG
jgi:hypothetical protein